MPANQCPLCASLAKPFFISEKHNFFSCENCKGIFRDPKQILSLEQEKKRYLLHQNHLEDQGYLNFVSPMLEAVRSEYPSNTSGLDFGCGHTPVISEVLKSEGYNVDLYDPVFYPQRPFEGKTYDFVLSCEVIEHFLDPKKEFDLLTTLLKSSGKLFLMTSLYSEAIDFGSWYYKNDPTHVFLYRKETLNYIAQTWDFNQVFIKEPLVVFSK